MMTTNENQELKCDVLILATGTYHEWIREAAPELMIPPLTPVAGGYGEWDVELEGPSFVLNLDKINVVYQSQSKKFLLGATSFSGSMSSFDFDHQSKLAEMHQMFIKNFPMFRKVLPLDKMRLKVGMRAKAKQRRMMVEILGDNFWVFNGFYKNGFSLPLLGAQKIISFYEKEAQ